MELIASTKYRLQSPSFDTSGNLFLACSASGTLLSLNGNALEPFMEAQGSPVGIAFDPNNGDAFLCDVERQAILKVESDNESGSHQPTVTSFIQQFEGRALIGPQRLRFTPSGEMVFTDGGARGETSLGGAARGAVYRTVQRRQQLLRVCSGLAGPSGVAVDGRNGVIYVCETAENRILRFVPHPDGHLVSNVWARLQGGFGPVDVDVHPVSGDVFVAQSDAAEVSSTGRVTVLSATGEEKGVIVVPSPEISGIALNPAGDALYIATCPPRINADCNLYRCAVGAA